MKFGRIMLFNQGSVLWELDLWMELSAYFGEGGGSSILSKLCDFFVFFYQSRISQFKEKKVIDANKRGELFLPKKQKL